MTSSLATISPPVAFENAVAEAIARIPPLWPLRHFVAVNPFVGLADRSFESACCLLQRTLGSAPLLAPVEYLHAFREGQISLDDLAEVATPPWTVESLIAFAEKPEETRLSTTILTVADALDTHSRRPKWSRFVVEEIGKWCAVHFDQNQTAWSSPWRSTSLYQAWREAASLDRNPEAFGLPGFREYVAALPPEVEEAIGILATTLLPPHLDPVDFFHRQLTTVSGWAGHAQYLAHEYKLHGKHHTAVRDLLAIRLAYDGALLNAFGRDGLFRANWRSQFVSARGASVVEALVQWQNAYERGYQRTLAASLAGQPSQAPSDRPEFQAIFCIDVRSEIFRRHLESVARNAQTLGFAGFFGFAVSHQPSESQIATPRCPVLFAPPLSSTDCASATDASRAASRRNAASTWFAFQNAAASCFSFVETAGLGFAAALAMPRAKKRLACLRTPAPRITPSSTLSLDTLAAAAESALRGMSLQQFARLVLVCGHGSESANNPRRLRSIVALAAVTRATSTPASPSLCSTSLE